MANNNEMQALRRELALTKQALRRQEKLNDRLNRQLADAHGKAMRVLICLKLALKEL